MEKSNSNRRLVNCEFCNKKESSNSKGKYYAQTKRINNIYTLVLSCVTCKGLNFFKIKEPVDVKNWMRLHTGIIYHCFERVLYAYVTKYKVYLRCPKCGENQSFEMDKK